MINIDLNTSIKVTDEDESLFVTFGYNPEILAKIKTIKHRHWVNELKAWEFSQASIQELIHKFGEENLDIDINIDLDYVKEEVVLYTDRDWSIFNPLLSKMPKDIADFTILVLESIPSYFYTIPASSSGRFHPQYALGDGGLARHTLAMGLISLDLFGNETICGQFSNREQSLMLCAEVLHDTFKQGLTHSGHTVAEHPLLASVFIKELEQNILSKKEVEIICGCIATHMGSWNKDYTGKFEILDKPSTEMQKFVHLVDFLASRAILEVNFDKAIKGIKS